MFGNWKKLWDCCLDFLLAVAQFLDFKPIMSIMIRKLRQVGIIVGSLAILYIVLYGLLTLRGQYLTYGLGETRPENDGGETESDAYVAIWVPRGFYDFSHRPIGRDSWRRKTVYFFYPLFTADTQFIHTNKTLFWVTSKYNKNGKLISSTTNYPPNKK
jgi:hypothetical protein